MSKIDPLRRKFILGAGAGLGLAATGVSSKEVPRFTQILRGAYIAADNSTFDPLSHSFEDSDMCVVSAEAIEGPYYVEDASLVREDIREGKEGVPLEVVMKIVSADGCKPIRDAKVDIWHCDALGYYSRYTANDPLIWPGDPGHAKETDNETFLRGRQVSDTKGMVRFQTIYPGWYSPRTQHIHARIFLGEKVGATVQLYFPERLNREVCFQHPYDQRSPSPFNNQNDSVIARSEGAAGSWLKMTKQGKGYKGTLTIGVAG